MDKLGKILENVVARQPGTAAFVEARLRLALAAVLGKDLAAGCVSVEVRRSTVWITTSNRALAHQLRSDSGHLLRRLNEESPLRPRLRRLEVAESRPAPTPPQRGGSAV